MLLPEMLLLLHSPATEHGASQSPWHCPYSSSLLGMRPAAKAKCLPVYLACIFHAHTGIGSDCSKIGVAVGTRGTGWLPTSGM